MSFRKKRIIIADDNKTFIMYSSIILTRMGFNVIPAENGVEVLKLTKIMEPDLILLDVHMSPIDGVKTLTYLKEDPQTSHLPVIMVSVDSNQEMISTCGDLGAAGYLAKPLNIEKLHSVLQDNVFSAKNAKRKYIRVGLNRKVTVRRNGQESVLFAETLSLGGIYLRSLEPFEAGTPIEVDFTFDNMSLELKGQVVYIKALYGDVFRVPPGMAVEFRDITDAQRLALKYIVKKLLVEDILEFQDEPVITLDDDV